MGIKLINTTFKYFTTPFAEGSRARNDALDLDSPQAALRAHLYSLAQIVASAVSTPFLILAGLYDALNGNANIFDIPKAVITQIFMILPLSIIGTILPLSVSKKIDDILEKRTQQRRVNNLLENRSLPLLQVELHTLQERNQLKTIEQLDLEKAIFKKTERLRTEADQMSLADIHLSLNEAFEVDTDFYADRYEVLKIKQQKIKRGANQSTATLLRLIHENDPTTIVRLDANRSLAVKIANSNRTTPRLREDIERGRRLREAPNDEARAAILAEADNEESRAIATLAAMDREVIEMSIVERYTLDSIAMLEAALAQMPEGEAAERDSINLALEKKRYLIRQYLRSESIEQLREQERLAPQNRIFPQDFALVLQRKNEDVDALACRPLTQLQTDLEHCKNPSVASDLSEAIQRHYCKNFSFVELTLLAKNDPDNSLLLKALEAKTQRVDGVVEANTLEILLENPPAPESPKEHSDRMEAIQRKYIAINTLDELNALWTANPENENIRKAHHRKQDIIRSLLHTYTLEELSQAINREPNLRKKAELQTARVKKLENINHLVNTKTRRELYILSNAFNDRISSDNLTAARNQKERQIIEIARIHTLEALQNREGRPDSPVAVDDWNEATQFKDQLINRLVNENTLEQLQALRGRNDLSPIAQNDLDLAIQRKTALAPVIAPAPAIAPAADPVPVPVLAAPVPVV